MQQTKACFKDGLIQLTVFLSLIGVRVDVEYYLNSVLSSPLIEVHTGPFVQTPSHRHQELQAGHFVHPKCPEPDDYFTSRRLLNKVRALGSPVRFPTRLSAWLVHLAPNGAEPVDAPNSDGFTGDQDATEETCNRPEANSTQTEEEIVKDNEEGINPGLPSQQIQSLALEQEALCSSSVQHRTREETAVYPELPDFLSDLSDFESLISQYVPDRADGCYNASFQDAMFSSSGNCRPDQARGETCATLDQISLLCDNSSDRDTPGMAFGSLAIPPAPSVGNSFQGTSHSTVGGYLDEAVFEQINLLGLEGLTSLEGRVPNLIDATLDTPWLEDLDSDSGLSLETNSRSPDSVSTSSSDSFCEGGATGYSSEVEALLSYGGPCASSSYAWSQESLNKKICHDHTYSAQSPDGHDPQSWDRPPTAIKQEVLSGDESGHEEPSRDEQRLQDLGLPFSASAIVNMPVEDFLDLLEGGTLSTSEVMLLRDVRRRGKNKLAAQNCRKRKLDAIFSLQAEVAKLVARRDALLRERTCTNKALSATVECFKKLSHDVLRQLRDEQGLSLNPEQYTLHYGSQGRIVVRPRSNAVRRSEKTTKRKKDKKH